MNTVIAEVIVLILLHTPGGHEVEINPSQIVSLRAAEGGEKNQLFTGEVHCMVNTSDGKYITVAETCEQVHTLVKEYAK